METKSENNSNSEHGTILSELNKQVAKSLDKVAFIEGSRRLKYRELQIQSKVFSQKLRLGEHEFVAILLPSGIDFIVSALAVIGSSKKYCPLSVDFPQVKLLEILQELKNPPLITTTAVLESVQLIYGGPKYLLEAQDWVNTDTSEKIDTAENEVAGVYFTSGSTGKPKAVIVGNRSLVVCVKNKAERLNIGPNDELVCVLNPAFLLSLTATLNILVGATIHFPPNNLRYDMDKLREWVKDLGTVTVICTVSSSGEAFFQAEPTAFPTSVRSLVLAGEKLQTRPPTDAPFTVYSDYGSTETLGIAIAEIGHDSSNLNPVTHTLVGTALKDVKIFILQNGLRPCSNEEVGEIAIGGPSISFGYWNDPALTAEKFKILEHGTRVCMMGDLGLIQADGNLIVLNRRDNQLNVAGNRFDLADLETALLQYENVEKTVAVVEKADDLRFHLFYKLKDDVEAVEPDSEHEILDFLQQRLPHYALPHSVTKVKQFLRNSNGKIDKEALLKIRNQTRKVVEPGVSETEEILTQIWSKVLNIEINQISRNDNFFSLGGNSSAVAKVVNELQERNFSVEHFHIFKVPVLKNLAALLENNLLSQDQIDFDAEVASFHFNSAVISELDPFDFTKKASGVLVTGITGYLGGRLLHELLTRTEADIYCLVRASSASAAEEKLDHMSRNAASRVHLIYGNISEPFFGLPESEYNSLAGVIDQIYHCAAEVHWLKRYQELKPSNVLGTVEILKFAYSKKLKFLHYISTVGVLDLFAEGRVSDEDRNISANPEHGSGYTQSKWVAEKLVWKAIDSGIPGIVYRPGIIGSHSQLNTYNPNDFITHLFKACKALGAFPEFAWEFPYGTLDFTVKCIFSTSHKLEDNRSKVFHTFQNVLNFESFYECFTTHSLKKVSLAEWKEMVSEASSKGAHQEIEAILNMKLFFSIPHYKGLTIFELPESNLANCILNHETMNVLSCCSSNTILLGEQEQVKNLAESIFSNK